MNESTKKTIEGILEKRIEEIKKESEELYIKMNKLSEEMMDCGQMLELYIKMNKLSEEMIKNFLFSHCYSTECDFCKLLIKDICIRHCYSLDDDKLYYNDKLYRAIETILSD